MEEYRKHILNERRSNTEKRPISFCGKDVSMIFHFTGVDHLMSSIQAQDRLLPCKECKRVIKELLENED